MRAIRSLLAVPATRRKMVEKALASDADAVFLDLEDAVAPDSKAAARTDVVYASEELCAVSILLSQLELAMDLETGKIKLEAQIESAEGLVNADTIANSTPRLDALHFGPGDFAATLRMPLTSIGVMDEWDEAYPGHRFHYAMQRIGVAARAAGLRILDGPVADYGDEEGLRRSCQIARSLGFDGKWCIHPAQIAVVNDVFSPSDREVEWARKVVAAFAEANAARTGAVSVDGQMVDAASIRMARNMLGEVPK